MGSGSAPLVHNAPYVSMVAEPLRSIITVRWRNFAPSGTYRATLNLAAEWIGTYGLRYFLTDQRRRGPILHEDEHWLVTDLAPRMAAAGLRRAAIIQSPDFFNRTSLERMVEQLRGTVPFSIMNFKTEEDALDWLASSEGVVV